ncbi:response regulator transcription factor [Tenuibacillus multivorans]|uniref:Two-component system, OmpR family, response regulator CssR n=1 Tax=Tenuibacillus multivorans TaxID=237069 RepID=A0A1H0FUB9_9BACI|nr:response regulator transcription factor [Tenuibacillus multivorans]GEL77877.1 DNA-binding response regulator [Tenuibacillus multivorans]SDN98162.1 two-component system, OmpR family, response regulator CssR [Tenuibacillus multivorans]
MKHIAVVEDDVNIQNIVSAYLKKANYNVTVLDSAEEGMDFWQSTPPDMWILDIMLPGMDGYDFCKKIRSKSEVPIIIISAKDEEVDKILGLELGGDDYLTKPFSPGELVARIKRLFKRVDATQVEQDKDDYIKMLNLVIQLSERRVFWNGKEIELTSKEFDLLTLFSSHPNRAFSREELLNRIWGDDYFGSDRAVDDLVKRIRKKLNHIPIETVWGFGYRFKVDEGSL